VVEIDQVTDRMKICRHQEREIAAELTAVLPNGLTKKDRAQWQRDYIEFLIEKGTIARRCPTCGHRARGGE
jgi:hypothetical protein